MTAEPSDRPDLDLGHVNGPAIHQLAIAQPLPCSELLNDSRQPQSQPRLIRRILVPTDFSTASTKALDCAVNLALDWKAALTILHVIDVNAYHAGAELGGAAHLMKRLWTEGSTRMGQLACSLAGHVDAQVYLEEGLPGEVIIEKSQHFDLVLIGNDRSKRVWKLFSQHTKQRVIENAFCPVMVV